MHYLPPALKTYTIRVQRKASTRFVEAGTQGTNQRIWQVVATIPAGCVSTYGDVARYAGLGRAARRVGWALRQLPPDTRIPWHRVINSAGTLSLPGHSEAGRVQRERLAGEGVPLRNGNRIRLSHYRWRPEAGPDYRPN